jgi:hypothetical protein
MEHCRDGPDQLRARAFFRDIARCAGFEGAARVLFLGIHAQDQHGQFGAKLFQLL